MMRALGVALLIACGPVWADVPGLPPLPPSLASAPMPPGALKPLPAVRNGAFDLRFVNVGQVVDLVYGDALKVPHVISSDVLEDTRLVSFQFDSSKGDLHDFFKAFLDSQGFEVVTRNGVDFVGKKRDARPAERETFVYTPRHRSASYLLKLVQPLFGSRLSSVAEQQSARSVAAAVPVSASGVPAAVPSATVSVYDGPMASAGDQLVFVGAPSDVKQVKSLLPELDTAVGEVVVRGWAYEVDDTDGANTGFSIVSRLLGVGVQVGGGSAAIDTTALQFGAGRLSFAISALSTDSRFHEVSSPNVRCVSGQQVKLNVGQRVPTVSSISYQGASGTPVQSIEYQDAGVIFNVTPTVLQDTIQLSIDEEISSFAATTTGVNGSPTKSTRSLQTVAALKDGEVIVLGGLIQDQDSETHSGQRWLPSFLHGHTRSKGRTEVVLVLQVQKV
ncbi:type II secretory pathway protein [Burkholderia latens]|uniref:type II secretion system protein GspD n=1 Tax=Burkholderia latens TaxID=488446 RepID=UPI001C9582AF|nr:type II secretory pathway protein [Burkholderia latens]MBY4692624.1 type II secretory pathway protein [Burkholderia latens]